MAEDNLTLDTFYDNWKLYQEQLKTALSPLTDEQLALRAAPHLRSIEKIAAHIIGARIGWFTTFLMESGTGLQPRSEWDRPESPVHSAAALAQGLDVTWQMIAECLSRWNSADMAKIYIRERNGTRTERTRGWVVWHLLEHDLHHGGEISLTLGIHGLQAPDI